MGTTALLKAVVVGSTNYFVFFVCDASGTMTLEEAEICFKPNSNPNPRSHTQMSRDTLQQQQYCTVSRSRVKKAVFFFGAEEKSAAKENAIWQNERPNLHSICQIIEVPPRLGVLTHFISRRNTSRAHIDLVLSLSLPGVWSAHIIMCVL